MQRVALALLLIAAAIFIVTLFLPQTFGVRLLKAMAEAAMVGALADWFAVVALFKRPLGLPIPHTAVIPANKDRIGENLAAFVKEKFLDPESLVQLIRRHDPAQAVATWLNAPANVRKLSDFAMRWTRGWLEVVDDTRIQAFIADAARSVVGKLDFSHALASVLTLLTQGGRHQQLLDALLGQLVRVLQKPEVREQIAQRVVAWLKTEHRWKQVVLPTEWIGEKTAEAASEWIDRFLLEVAQQPEHELRVAFDDGLQRLIDLLHTDGVLQQKGEELKSYIVDNPQFADYVRQLWNGVRQGLVDDLDAQAEGSRLSQQIEKMGGWLAQRLSEDEALRRSLDEHLEDLVRKLAPQVSDFLARHISDTVKKWDATELSRQVELHIGRDLQFIRINGTLIGGLIGVLLFLASTAPEWWAWWP